MLTEKIFLEIKNFINDPVLVLSGDNWHEGIIGIVASRIKDKYNKPTVLISLNDNLGKGSARSILGFDIGAEIIKAVQMNILQKGGGHKMAGGFSLEKKNISTFRNFLIKSYKKSQVNMSSLSNLYIDSIIAPSAVNEEFYNEINILGPFGSGNSEPKFVIENLRLISSKVIAEKHIKSLLSGKDGSVLTSFAWNAKGGPLETLLIKNKNNLHIAGKMKLNEWKGKKNIEFIIEDIAIN